MAEKQEKPQLTKEELQIAIQCIANTQVTVKDAPKLIEIINKMSLMIDEIDK